MSLNRFVRQLKPIKENKVNYVEEVQFLLEKRVDTTLSASITELFPALAFNNNYKPISVEDFKKFLYKLSLKSAKAKASFNAKDAVAAQGVLDKMTTLPEKIVKTKMENAIGITNYLYSLHATKPIKNVVWGYRAKPRGVPNNHAGDIFVEFKNKEMIGISLKAGTAKSTEPLLNSYVKTQFIKLGQEGALKKMEDELWDSVYSKLPNIDAVASKINYADGDRTRTNDIRQIYLDFHLENEILSNELYATMVLIQRQHFCNMLNTLKLEEFKDWVSANFNLQTPQKVPLILVKAVGKTAEPKGDDLASLLPLVSSFKAYLNPKSVQEWFIDIDTPDELKKLKMTIRSDAGVREGKKLSKLGRLAKFSMLKLQYSGLLDR